MDIISLGEALIDFTHEKAEVIRNLSLKHYFFKTLENQGGSRPSWWHMVCDIMAYTVKNSLNGINLTTEKEQMNNLGI